MPIVHVRLAVPSDFLGVVAKTQLIREWIDLGAWRAGAWGVGFPDGLEPVAGEAVVSHTRNSGFHNSTPQEVLLALEVRDIICCGVSTAYAV